MSGLEIQQRVLEEAARRKVESEASRVRSDGTSARVVGTSAQGSRTSKEEVVPSTVQPPWVLRDLTKIAKKDNGEERSKLLK